jgi:hypothetical protein
LPKGSAPSRRLTSRVEAPGGVWVYWQCKGRDDVSRVRDLSLGGLFIETNQPCVPGVTAKLHFLVQEGQIRAETIVRHALPGLGLGLKFLAVSEQDRPQLVALMTRLRGLSYSPANRKRPLPDPS